MEYPETTRALRFDAHGLIPAIVQDHYTKQVLTLAYMNAETLALTIAEGRTVFWSRSPPGDLAQGRDFRPCAAGRFHHGRLRQRRAGRGGRQGRPGLPHRGRELLF